MKKLLSFLCLAATGLGLTCCSYDDSMLKSEIESLKTRLTSLENSYKQLSNYQTIVANLKSVTDVKDNGDGSYTIQFSDNTAITLKGGKNGTDGTNGTNGKDGVTPRFRIQDGDWQVSYDEGSTWTTLGSASGNDLFQNVYMDGDILVLVLADGTEFRVGQGGGPGPGQGDGPGGGGQGEGPGGGGQGGELTPQLMSNWSAVFYPYGGSTWLYVYEATGNYSFYAVKADAGDFSSQDFIKEVLSEYDRKLAEYYATNTFTVLDAYSYEEYGVYNVSSNVSIAVAEYIARRDAGDGKYRVLMVGVNDQGHLTGDYYVLGGDFTVGTVTYNNPEDAVSYGVVNMTGTSKETDKWRAQLYSNYVYVYRPVDETWLSFYAVPNSLDLTDTSVAEGLLKEFEGLLKSYYADGSPTVNTGYASTGTFNVFSFTGASYAPHQNVVNVRDGATGELQILMIALKTDLSVSGRYAIVEGTFSK